MKDSIRLLNIDVDAVTIHELNREVKKIVTENRKEIIANHNLHSVYLFNNFPDLRKFWDQAYLTHIDGMPLIWWGKVLSYPLKKHHRVTYLDWIHPLLTLANSESWRVFYLGGKPGVAQKASAILKNSYAQVEFKTHSGFFDVDVDSSDNNNIISSISNFNPHILLVGMGMPRQEQWILQNYSRISANVILNCGACFDYIAGEQRKPPRFLGQLGLEWLYRLIFDPRRLFKRYVIEPITLLPLLKDDLLKKAKREYSGDDQ